MKPSEKKQKFVEELIKLYEDIDVNRLYAFPNQKDTQQWLSNVASLLKNLDESDYQEIVRLSKTVGLSGSREERKRAAQEINQFLGRKVAEWSRYDFSSLDSEDNSPKIMFGEAGGPGQPGGGGSIFIQAQNFTLAPGGNISANGGDYIVHQNTTSGDNSSIQENSGVSFGTIDQTTAETIQKITELMELIGKSELADEQKMQLLGNAEIVKASIIQPHPDKNILQKAWDGMQAASTIAGAIQLIQIIANSVLPHLK